MDKKIMGHVSTPQTRHVVATSQMHTAESMTLSLADRTSSLWNYYLCPVCTTAYSGNLVQLKILLEQRNANVNERSFDGETALQLAARYGHQEILNYLLSNYSQKFTEEDICGGFVESLSSPYSTQQCYHILKSYCEQNHVVHTNLMEALCKNSPIELIFFFYSICLKKNITVDVDKMLSTTFRFSKDPRIVRWLLQDCYADPKSVFSEALTLASKPSKFTKDEEDILLMLLEYGLPLERKQVEAEGESAFTRLFRKSPQEPEKSFGHILTVIHAENFALSSRLCGLWFRSLEADHTDTRQAFLTFDAKSQQLLTAASTGDVNKIVELAKDAELQQKINYCRSESRNTPLGLGHLEAVKALLDNFQCDLNCTNNHNSTPLIMATHDKHADVVAELVKRGANKEIRTGRKSKNPGRTALDIAKANEQLASAFVQIQAILEGKDINAQVIVETLPTPNQ